MIYRSGVVHKVSTAQTCTETTATYVCVSRVPFSPFAGSANVDFVLNSGVRFLTGRYDFAHFMKSC